MSGHRRYSRSPLTEAVIDITVNPRDGVTVAALAGAFQPVAAEYPEHIDLNKATAKIDLGPKVVSSVKASVVGRQYRSADRRDVFQVWPNRFSVNRLAPYSGWEDLITRARRLWDIFRRETRPGAVTRLGVRYINRIELPGAVVELKDYFRVFPEIPAALPQALAHVLLRVAVPLDDIRAVAAITQTQVPPVTPDTVAVVLDFDLSREAALPVDDRDLWILVDRFREKKNLLFEESITDKLRELIL